VVVIAGDRAVERSVHLEAEREAVIEGEPALQVRARHQELHLGADRGQIAGDQQARVFVLGQLGEAIAQVLDRLVRVAEEAVEARMLAPEVQGLGVERRGRIVGHVPDVQIRRLHPRHQPHPHPAMVRDRRDAVDHPAAVITAWRTAWACCPGPPSADRRRSRSSCARDGTRR
jgi:hypothetical protein